MGKNKKHLEIARKMYPAYLGERLDYDLFVIDPANSDTTPGQLRDCIYHALKTLDERTHPDRRTYDLCLHCGHETWTAPVIGRCEKCGGLK